jgi:hypothetical protein
MRALATDGITTSVFDSQLVAEGLQGCGIDAMYTRMDDSTEAWEMFLSCVLIDVSDVLTHESTYVVPE